MIELTKLNKKKFFLNCELIESIESTPDTVITLHNGKFYIVSESPEVILEKVMVYKHEVFKNFTGLTSPPVFAQEKDEAGI